MEVERLHCPALQYLQPLTIITTIIAIIPSGRYHFRTQILISSRTTAFRRRLLHRSPRAIGDICQNLLDCPVRQWHCRSARNCSPSPNSHSALFLDSLQNLRQGHSVIKHMIKTGERTQTLIVSIEARILKIGCLQDWEASAREHILHQASCIRLLRLLQSGSM